MPREITDDIHSEATKILAELAILDILKPPATGLTDMTQEECVFYKRARSAYTACKKCEKTQAVFNCIYDQAVNPYELALKFHVKGINYQNCKSSSLTYYVLEALNVYSATHPDKHSLLDDSLKGIAFNLTKRDPNSTIFQIVSEAYRFPESNHLFEPHVRQLISENSYVAAAQFAHHCGVVHEDFVAGFLVPLFLDRQQILTLYKYIDGVKSLQNSLMKLLDSMLTPNGNEKIQTMLLLHKYCNIPPENLTVDYIKKNLPKLQKRFGTDPTVIPNSSYGQAVSSIYYWVVKLSKKETAPDSFKLWIENFIPRNNIDLQMALLSNLFRFDLKEQCLYWIQEFQIDIRQLPRQMQCKLDVWMRHNRGCNEERREEQQWPAEQHRLEEQHRPAQQQRFPEQQRPTQHQRSTLQHRLAEQQRSSQQHRPAHQQQSPIQQQRPSQQHRPVLGKPTGNCFYYYEQDPNYKNFGDDSQWR